MDLQSVYDELTPFVVFQKLLIPINKHEIDYDLELRPDSIIMSFKFRYPDGNKSIKYIYSKLFELKIDDNVINVEYHDKTNKKFYSLLELTQHMQKLAVKGGKSDNKNI